MVVCSMMFGLGTCISKLFFNTDDDRDVGRQVMVAVWRGGATCILYCFSYCGGK